MYNLQIFPQIAIPFIALTTVGWILVAVGFGFGSYEPFGRVNDRSDPSSYPYWVVCFTGPLVIVTAFFHAALTRKPISPVMGAIVASCIMRAVTMIISVLLIYIRLPCVCMCGCTILYVVMACSRQSP